MVSCGMQKRILTFTGLAGQPAHEGPYFSALVFKILSTCSAAAKFSQALATHFHHTLNLICLVVRSKSRVRYHMVPRRSTTEKERDSETESSDYIARTRCSSIGSALPSEMCSPDVVNGAKESGTVLFAASDEQVVPQRVELVSVCHEIYSIESRTKNVRHKRSRGPNPSKN